MCLEENPLEQEEIRIARVVRQERGAWTVEVDGRARLIAHVRGEERPVVGDEVELRPGLEAIERVLPRRSVVARRRAGTRGEAQVLAANADAALVVMGLDGDYNPRRLERYLAMTAGCGVRAAVVLNKRDVCADAARRVDEIRGLVEGVAVVAMSALGDDAGMVVKGLVERGETVVLLGSSGAGKSTLVNRLLGREEMATGVVREGDDRGRHTTTSRRLLAMPGGWWLIDIPGLREVGLLPGASAPDTAFGGVRALAAGCRFRDCTHTVEPGCAVRERIPEERLTSFQKLSREGGFHDRRYQKQMQKALRAFQRTERFNRW